MSYTVSISGNSNESKLVIASEHGQITGEHDHDSDSDHDSDHEEIEALQTTAASHTTTLASHTTTLASHTTSLASHTSSLASHTSSLVSHETNLATLNLQIVAATNEEKPSIYNVGLADVWSNVNGNIKNTGYMPSQFLRPSTAISIGVQKHSEILPLDVESQTYNFVFDETHLYGFITGNVPIGYAGSFGSDQGRLVKIDRQTGKVTSRAPISIFGSIDLTLNVGVRQQPSLLGEFIYVCSAGVGTNMISAIAKLKKSDLSTVWTKQVVTEPSDIASMKTISHIMAFMPNQSDMPLSRKNKAVIVYELATTFQYGGRAGAKDYTHNYKLFKVQGGAGAVIDNGTTADIMWTWSVGPKLLVANDPVPDTAFIQDASFMRIIYPMVNFDSNDSTNYVGVSGEKFRGVDVSGVKGFKCTENFNFQVTLDKLVDLSGSTATKASQLNDPSYNSKLSDISAQGLFQCVSGTIFFDKSTCLYDCSGILGASGETVSVPGSHIFRGQALTKKIHKGGVPLDKYDAYNMNYWGSGSYGAISYDICDNIVYIGTANGHAQPLEDGLQLTENLNVADLAQKYQFAIRDLFAVPPTKTSAEVQTIFNQYTAAIQLAKDKPKSPRNRRFLPDSVVAFDVSSGEMLWADGANAYDPFTWQEDSQPLWRSILRGNNGDIVTGATILTIKDASGTTPAVRRLFAGDKSAHTLMYNPDTSYSIVSISGETLAAAKANNYINGIKEMNPPEHSYEVVGIAGGQGGCLWGGCSDAKLYVTHQINAPFGGHILRDIADTDVYDATLLQGGFGQLTAKLGFISDKIVENSEGLTLRVDLSNGLQDGKKRLIPYGTGYLVAVDCSSNLTKWICPLSSTYEADNTLNAKDSGGPGDSNIPIISDQGPPRQFGNLIVCGMASGKVHFVDARTGKMINTISFPQGCAAGVCGSGDTIYLQPGWNKWNLGENPPAKHTMFLTCNGQ